MFHTTEILQNISTLSLEQKISLIEEILHTVKDDIFKQVENNNLNNVKNFYQIFLLNNEVSSLNSLIKKSTENLSIKKGDKTLNPKELFGIWENNPCKIQDIRKYDWQRKWNF